MPSVFRVPRVSVHPLCTHKWPRAITSRHFEHETHRWYVVYSEPYDMLDKITTSEETKETCNAQKKRRIHVARKRNRKNERISRARSQVALESLTWNSRCIRISYRETAASNQSQVYASNFYLLEYILPALRRSERTLAEIIETLMRFKTPYRITEQAISPFKITCNLSFTFQVEYILL